MISAGPEAYDVVVDGSDARRPTRHRVTLSAGELEGSMLERYRDTSG